MNEKILFERKKQLFSFCSFATMFVMTIAYFQCKQCGSEFELFEDDERPQCLVCDSFDVQERKNSTLNCSVCCDGCSEKENCDTFKQMF